MLSILLMLFGDYSTKQSMQISYVLHLGGSLASIIKNYQIKDSVHGTQRFVVDYDMVIVTLPMAASGALIGSFVNRVLSELVITICYVVLLGYLCWTVYKKLRESRVMQTQLALIKEYEVQMKQKTQTNQSLQQLLRQETVFILQNMKIVLFVFLLTVVTIFLKGNSQYHSILAIDSCGIFGNLLLALHLLCCYFCTVSVLQKIKEKDQKKQQFGYVFVNSCDKMCENKGRVCMWSGLGAGILGGSLGLGGALILVPVWLSYGVDQKRATATSPFLIFFSSLVPFVFCLLSGQYESFVTIIFFFVLSYIGSALVKNFIIYLVERYRLKQMVLILLMLILLVSLMVLVPFEISKYLDDPQDFMEFGQFC